MNSIEYVTKLFTTINSVEEKHCFAMGYDAAVNGANTTNCSFALFSSRERTTAWEAGNRKGIADREAAQHSVEPTKGTPRKSARRGGSKSKQGKPA